MRTSHNRKHALLTSRFVKPEFNLKEIHRLEKEVSDYQYRLGTANAFIRNLQILMAERYQMQIVRKDNNEVFMVSGSVHGTAGIGHLISF